MAVVAIGLAGLANAALGLGALGLGALGVAALVGIKKKGGNEPNKGGYGYGYETIHDHGYGGYETNHDHGYGGYETNHNHGHGQGYGGHGHSYGGYHRRRRQANELEFNSKDARKKESFPSKKTKFQRGQKQVQTVNEEALLAAIRDSDDSGCGFRLVCELAGANLGQLSQDEMEILRFVQFGDQASAQGDGLLPNSPVLVPYQTAGHLGASGADCAQIYSTCKTSGSQIMSIIRTVL